MAWLYHACAERQAPLSERPRWNRSFRRTLSGSHGREGWDAPPRQAMAQQKKAVVGGM